MNVSCDRSNAITKFSILFSVPKVSIDGESHGDLLLIAIGSGATFAVIILVVLTSLIRHKKQPIDKKLKKDESSGNFTLAASSSDSGISTASSQKSNLMFKYFGQSLSSFDLEKSPTNVSKPTRRPSSSIAVNIDSNNQKQLYRENISDLKDECDNDKKIKNIHTIA